jgi:hypothetical protein
MPMITRVPAEGSAILKTTTGGGGTFGSAGGYSGEHLREKM